MPFKPKTLKRNTRGLVGYDLILTDVVSVLESARGASSRAVNAFMTASYWQIGRRIVDWEQEGKERSKYGDRLLDKLSADLTRRFGRGFGREGLRLMRKLYLTWLMRISQTPSGKFASSYSDALDAQVPISISQTPSGKSRTAIVGTASGPFIPQTPTAISEALSRIFPLPWSHYVRLLSVKNDDAREFYETEALRGGWSVKQLHRQINSLFYERTALSGNKAAMLTRGAKAKPEDTVTPEESLKDPFVLEFLGLKDEYSETQIEDSLIRHLESFLMELGGDFAFVGRQRRLRIGHQWYRIDLLFFHRKLRCLVIIDLKTGELTHADAGQMHLYLNYATEHWINPGENPPVGLILCAQQDAAMAHYALDNLPNKVLAAEYKMNLPDARTLAAEIKRTRRSLETHALTHARDRRL